MHDAIKDKMENLEGIKGKLAKCALKSKLSALKTDGTCTHSVWDKIIFSKTKEAFGGRVQFMVTGSAPINGEILDFLKVVCCCPFYEAYG